MKTISQKLLASMLLLLLVATNLVSGQYEHYLDSLHSNELYEYVEGSGSQQFLAKGNSEQAPLQLEPPIAFYGEKYDKIFVSNICTYIYAVHIDRVSDRCDNKVAIEFALNEICICWTR